MNVNNEKTSSVMGIVISLLLHGIFFAGCIAIGFTVHPDGSTSGASKTEVSKMATHSDLTKIKS